MNEIGHNLPPETFHTHVAAMAKARANSRLAKASEKKVRQRAKADGIILKDLDRALVIADMPREDQTETLNNMTSYLRMLRVPVGAQLSLLEVIEEDAASEEDAKAKAAAQGFLAGVSGKSENCPYEPNQAVGMAWLDAYRDGRAKYDAASVDDGE